ncbi:MAG TPA: TspO/MBR family protein [Steroidobacteraceae bacterium]|nr:TspO/MBR family protein [Steroidobacteraceae bacterium]
MNDTDVSLRITPSSFNAWLALAGWVAVCAVAGAIGALASVEAKEFYASLDQPAWAPPAGVFGPVWTLLYASMAVAAWLVWRERGFARARGALGLFLIQLALNALWSWLFFAWHQGAFAFVDILALLALIVATMVSFAKIRKLAAWLLAPYLAWVGFATLLSYSVWQRNPLAL